jgi:hypothetical protein
MPPSNFQFQDEGTTAGKRQGLTILSQIQLSGEHSIRVPQKYLYKLESVLQTKQG